MARTKDWGAEFSAVDDLFRKKGGAQRAHERGMNAEIAGHDGSHSFGRHGYQTGWEQQLIRAVTGVTPDKSFDPRGIDPALRTWNSGPVAESAYNDSGEATVDIMGHGFDPVPADYGPEKGPQSAGAFLSPMAHQKAIHLAQVALQALQSYPVAQYQHKSHKVGGVPSRINLPVVSCSLVVTSNRAGEPLGVGFGPKNGSKASVRKCTREEVVKLINGFQSRQTWNQLFQGRTASLNKFHVKDQVAFPNLSDLLDFLGVEPLWQGAARGGYRRDYNPATRTVSPWRMMTLFPDDFEAGFKPSLRLSAAHKATLHAQSLPQKGYRWTGRLSSFDGTRKTRLPIPPWVNLVP